MAEQKIAIGEEVRKAMCREDAKELGLIPDDALGDPTEIPVDILEDWGLSPEEVGR